MFEQLAINAIVTAAPLSLLAVGFALIFHVARFFHFAHGAVFTIGAFSAFLFKERLGLPLGLAIPLAVLTSIAVGCLMDRVVYRPLRQRDASAVILLVASLGLYICLQNAVSLAFGDDIKTLQAGTIEPGISIIGGRITTVQLWTVLLSGAVLGGLGLVLRRTSLGRNIRAVANDSELAHIVGIRSESTILVVFAIGSALAGLAGVLVALDVGMTPTMGLHALMMAIVAAIIGGVGSLPGVICGSLLLAIAQHFGIWKLPSQWQDAIAFVILLLFLLIRPQGFFGKPLRTTAV